MNGEPCPVASVLDGLTINTGTLENLTSLARWSKSIALDLLRHWLDSGQF